MSVVHQIVCETCGQTFEHFKSGQRPKHCPQHRWKRHDRTPREAAAIPEFHRVNTYREDARKLARESLGDDAARLDGSIERYAAASEMAALLVDAWHEIGCPATELGGVTGGTLIAHPLIKSISDAQTLAGKLADAAGLGAPKAARGRPVAAVSAPDRLVEPPHIRRIK